MTNKNKSTEIIEITDYQIVCYNEGNIKLEGTIHYKNRHIMKVHIDKTHLKLMERNLNLSYDLIEKINGYVKEKEKLKRVYDYKYEKGIKKFEQLNEELRHFYSFNRADFVFFRLEEVQYTMFKKSLIQINNKINIKKLKEFVHWKHNLFINLWDEKCKRKRSDQYEINRKMDWFVSLLVYLYRKKMIPSKHMIISDGLVSPDNNIINTLYIKRKSLLL